MLNTEYTKQKFALVKDPNKFFQQERGSSVILKVKAMYEAVRTVFNITAPRFEIMESDEDEVYKFTVVGSDYPKQDLGSLVFIPKARRLDVWVAGDIIPLLQFKVRTPVFRNYSAFLDRAGVAKIFDRMVNIL